MHAGSVQLAAAACPALTINFFPEGSKNSPTGWTREAQVAAGNEDTSSLNTIKLTASPAPKLFVQPVHPLFSRKACVPSDCLPASKGRRLQEAGRSSRIVPLRQAQNAEAAEDAKQGEQPVVAELQRWDAEQGTISRGLNNLLWNLPYNPFGRRQQKTADSASSGSSAPVPAAAPAPAANPSSSSAMPAPAPAPAPSSSSSEPAPAGELEAGAGAVAPIISLSGSGSSGLKESIGSAGGWTEWKEDDWWTGEDRQLQACLTTVAQTAAYDILWNIDGGVAKKATMPKQGAPFILLDNLDTLAPVSRIVDWSAFMPVSGDCPQQQQQQQHIARLCGSSSAALTFLSAFAATLPSTTCQHLQAGVCCSCMVCPERK